MKYIDLTEMIDYRPYLSYLETIKNKLPQNVRDYVTKEEHYDFSREYCPHDYWLETLGFNDINNSEKFNLYLKFRTQKFRIEFSYERVFKYSFNIENFIGDF